MKKIMIYTLTGFLALILIMLLISYPSYKKQMTKANSAAEHVAARRERQQHQR